MAVDCPVEVVRVQQPGVHATTVHHKAFTETFVTLHSLHHGEPALALVGRMRDFLAARPAARPVALDIWGRTVDPSQVLKAIAEQCPSCPRPTWVLPHREPSSASASSSSSSSHLCTGSACLPPKEDASVSPGGVVSALEGLTLQLHCLEMASKASPVIVDGVLVGMSWETPEARFLRVGGLVPLAQAGLPPAAQCEAILASFDAVLGSHGMTARSIARTWYFLDEILAWYSEFNAVRNAWFTKHKVFSGVVPASTAIGGPNPWGTAVVGGLIAVLPLRPSTAPTVAALASPLSCSALQYGSAFSRAVEVAPGPAAAPHTIFISGTASVALDGSTAHVGDIAAQIERTMSTIAAILKPRAAGWGDVTRMVAYFKREADVGAFLAYLKDHGLPPLPLALTANTVCRDDFLFEVELDAVVVGEPLALPSSPEECPAPCAGVVSS
eukprot:RCo030107